MQRSDDEGVTRPYLGKKYSDQIYKDLLSDIINLDLFQGYPVVTVIKGNDTGDVAVLMIKVVEKPIVDAIRVHGHRPGA